MKLRKLMILVLALTMTMAVASASFDAGKTITVVSREEGSGTRGAFVELTKVEVKNDAGEKEDMTYERATIANSTSIVITNVSQNEYAIGYASLASVQAASDKVKPLKIDGVDATVENILAETYPIARPFVLVTVKDGELSPLAEDFIKYILSAEGQEVINNNGVIGTVQDAPAYEAANLEGKLVVGGSSSVSPVMEKLKEAYQVLNPQADIEVQTTDSSSGVKNALNGSYEIGMSSRNLKDSELEQGAQPTVLGMDGIAVIVHLDNPTEDITAEQLRQVYVGEITTWADLSK
ncbi:MAG: substrate-binding domain-containing protein [Christensenellales bacterium]|jgi:phosphate transport system substrate-binding protein